MVTTAAEATEDPPIKSRENCRGLEENWRKRKLWETWDTEVRKCY